MNWDLIKGIGLILVGIVLMAYVWDEIKRSYYE
jgi:hypothetical protein